MERSDLEKEYYMMFGKWPDNTKKISDDKNAKKKKIGKEFTFDDVAEIEELFEDD